LAEVVEIAKKYRPSSCESLPRVRQQQHGTLDPRAAALIERCAEQVRL
jgi:hypothetical protein